MPLKVISKMRWSEAETKHFVKIFLNHEILWNPKHPHHGSRFERFKQQNSVIEIFKARTGISMEIFDLKMKVRSLKSTYCQEKNKVYNRSTSEFQYKPSLVWFEDWDAKMGKLYTYKPQKPKQSKGGENSEDSADHTNTSWVDNSSHDNEVDTEMDPFSESKTYISYCDDNVNEEKAEISDRSFKLDSELHCPESSTKPNSSVCCRCPGDEFDIYAKHIASQLRCIDLEKALKLQVEIQGLVSEARISGLAGK